MEFLNQLKQEVKALKSESIVIYHALKDRRTPWLAKVSAALTIAYLLSPIDLIPDFIPVLGLLDELVLVPLLIALTLKLIPENIITDLRSKISSDEKLQEQWYFAVPVILFYMFMLVWVYLKFFKN